ncbi:resuscitation-promoting factor interacting protein [Corynebacterium terpenotabidum Y-11]|uniref:Resuscitation-promoting factor interacting protein n=1 Tax=Corynebacterium terpenotabidum Y-11 TaxID=1200352 RepID=S4XJM4_9CORY|nr:resuscitation-promoting factor interacting protein [Corynebacterium terpenotabidum Y-11]
MTSRGRARGASLRSTGTLLAVAVAASLTSQAATAGAEESSDTGAEAYLADLVTRVSDTQDEVNALEGELGELRESVNKSRVDFDRSTAEAQEAQDQVTDARSRLGGSQDDLDTAQEDLDEIARSAYTQGGDASIVPLAAGSSADDAIDRATYIRLAAEKQQAEVDRLDLARTQAANEESRLRDARNTADDLVTAAQQAQSDVEEQLNQVQEELAAKAQSHQDLLAEAATAQAQLEAARAAVNQVTSDNADATSFDKRRAAEAAVTKVETTQSSTTTATEDTSGADASTDDSATTTTVAEESALPSATGSADTATGSSSAVFSQDSSGDTRRQEAIDGLVDAAGAGLVAGATAAANGGNALSAAAGAARDSAAQSYADLSDAQSGVGEDTGTLLGTGTGTSENTGDTSSPDATGTVAEQIERVVARGMSQLGVTYAWGGGNFYGPTLGIRDGGVADSYGDYNKVGFDCSGLMMYAFYAVGIELAHYSGYQYTSGTQVPVSEARRGDMLFWGSNGISHVALYLGDGTMLEAPQSGDVVKISDVRWSSAAPYAVRMIE